MLRLTPEVARLRMRPLASLLLALATSACTHVQAYERGNLAHPTMTTAPAVGIGAEHMYATQEGATGGGAAAEGGCGCN
jgi:hypothetical protein